jgi:hypothetical protein
MYLYRAVDELGHTVASHLSRCRVAVKSRIAALYFSIIFRDLTAFSWQ